MKLYFIRALKCVSSPLFLKCKQPTGHGEYFLPADYRNIYTVSYFVYMPTKHFVP